MHRARQRRVGGVLRGRVQLRLCSDANADAHRDSNAHADVDSNAHAHRDTDAYPHANTHRDPNADLDSNSYRNGDTLMERGT